MNMRKKEGVNVAERNARARAWLQAHDLFNVAKLCRRIGYDRGNFWGFEYGQRDLSDKTLTKLENVLVNYGYTIEQ